MHIETKFSIAVPSSNIANSDPGGIGIDPTVQTVWTRRLFRTMELLEMLRTITTGAIRTIVAGAIALVSLLIMTPSTRAQDEERPYPKMLPLEQYLMDRNEAIALARSAAPESISKDASVLVLTTKGWETAVKGTNGFVCMAGPSWTASIDFYDV